MTRQIIHVDMDAFYASIEQRDHPQYRGKPVVVGGDPDVRGVVCTCSYEARQFGIHSAMSSAVARKRCPDAIFVKPRFDAYRQASEQIRDIFYHYTDLVEPLALDEAYLDVTASMSQHGSAALIAKDIRQRIFHNTKLTASAGISYNKFLAKIASDRCKPDGSLLITERQGPEFARGLSIRDFYGVGRVTEEKMLALGIQKGEDLLGWTVEQLEPHFGKVASYYYHAARGIDERKVEAHRPSKSCGTEDTFASDVHDAQEMMSILNNQAESVAQSMLKQKISARTVTVKAKFADFTLLTRSVTVDQPISQAEDIRALLPRLLDSVLEQKSLPVRLLGVAVSNLVTMEDWDYRQQLSLL